MTIRIRAAAMAATLTVLGLIAAVDPIGAQEPAAPKPSEPVAKKRHDASRRVPDYFGQIGLTAEQRASIYSIQSKRFEKIDALEQQIATEKAEMLVQCETTLTEIQRKLLDNLRRAAAEPNTSKSTSTAKSAN